MYWAKDLSSFSVISSCLHWRFDRVCAFQPSLNNNDFTSRRRDIIKNVELHLVGQELTSFSQDFLMSFSVAYVDLFILLTNLWALDVADLKGRWYIMDVNNKLECMRETAYTSVHGQCNLPELFLWVALLPLLLFFKIIFLNIFILWITELLFTSITRSSSNSWSLALCKWISPLKTAIILLPLSVKIRKTLYRREFSTHQLFHPPAVIFARLYVVIQIYEQ